MSATTTTNSTEFLRSIANAIEGGVLATDERRKTFANRLRAACDELDRLRETSERHARAIEHGGKQDAGKVLADLHSVRNHFVEAQDFERASILRVAADVLHAAVDEALRLRESAASDPAVVRAVVEAMIAAECVVEVPVAHGWRKSSTVPGSTSGDVAKLLCPPPEPERRGRFNVTSPVTGAAGHGWQADGEFTVIWPDDITRHDGYAPAFYGTQCVRWA